MACLSCPSLTSLGHAVIAQNMASQDHKSEIAKHTWGPIGLQVIRKQLPVLVAPRHQPHVITWLTDLHHLGSAAGQIMQQCFLLDLGGQQQMRVMMMMITWPAASTWAPFRG